MGKQIRFFATNNDWCNLFDSIYSKGLYIIDDNGNRFNLCEVKDILHNPKNKIFMYYIVKDNWKIDYNGTFIFPLTSELIELSICRSIPQTTVDLSPVDKHFQKGEYIVVNDRDKYLKLYEDYMKDPIYVPNPHYIENGYEHGRFWCPTSYYDNNGNTVYQNKEVIKEYNFLVRLIKKDAIISQDKAFYIMPDAYKKYKENTFIPRAGCYSIDFK